MYRLNEETVVPLFDTMGKHVRMFDEKLETCKAYMIRDKNLVEERKCQGLMDRLRE